MNKIPFVFILCVMLSIGLVNCASSDKAIQAAIAATEQIEEQIQIGIQETIDVLDQAQTEVAITQTQESLHDECFPGGTYEDDEDDTDLAEYLDIQKVETSLENGILKTTLYLRDLPEEITVNYAPEGYLDYSWGVMIDVDSDQGTGNEFLYSSTLIIKGIDFELSISHYSEYPSKPITGPIEDVMGSAMVIENISESYVADYADANFIIDYEMNTFVFEGIIPGISEESVLYFGTYAYNDGIPQGDILYK